jgi:all-trans-retinol 13,14-reductase
LENGEQLTGDYFISDLHPARTNELLDTPLIRKTHRERILNLKNTFGNFTVYIQFRKNTVPYLNSNLYHYNDNEAIWGEYDRPLPGGFLYMHLCSSVEQQYADAAVLMTYMDYGEVARWAGKPVGRRGEDYETFKHQKAEELLTLLEEQLPGTRSRIERYYTSTPLTYSDYTGTEKGSMYGVLHDCNDPLQTMISQRTKIPNFFQTGQSVNFHGILGVIVSAFITSGELLDVNALLKQVKDS